MKKTCIITGGSSGIGLSIVQLFVANNYRVFNLDIAPSDDGDYVQCDITSGEQIAKAIENISAQHSIDVLISNAGKHLSASIENTSEEQLDQLFSLNVKGAFHAIKAVLPSMKKAQQGAIIIMASDQAVVAKNNSFAYNMSKAALASITKTTALDYAPFNITANAICPGTIETPLYHQAIDNYCQQSGANKEEIHQEEAALQPLGRLGQPEEVAQLALYLASEHARFITGSLQLIDGGYTVR